MRKQEKEEKKEPIEKYETFGEPMGEYEKERQMELAKTGNKKHHHAQPTIFINRVHLENRLDDIIREPHPHITTKQASKNTSRTTPNNTNPITHTNQNNTNITPNNNNNNHKTKSKNKNKEKFEVVVEDDDESEDEQFQDDDIELQMAIVASMNETK